MNDLEVCPRPPIALGSHHTEIRHRQCPSESIGIPGSSDDLNTPPFRPLRPCVAPGCSALTHVRRCPVHQRERERERGTTKERGYAGAWPRLRAMILAEEPLCRACLKKNCITPASQVDHIKPMRFGGARLDPSNLQALCGACHRLKTNAETRETQPTQGC